MQRFARAHVHAHVAERRDRHIVLPRDFLDGGAVGIVEGAVQQVQADPGATRKGGADPRGLGVQAVHAGAVVTGIG
ncbi:hypothetical protein LP419_29540 [Massilia sp. H-1]|nr:hypothetical protein LP419_29540 [Massilia sp. H-1]